MKTKKEKIEYVIQNFNFTQVEKDSSIIQDDSYDNFATAWVDESDDSALIYVFDYESETILQAFERYNGFCESIAFKNINEAVDFLKPLGVNTDMDKIKVGQ